jgi:hypothetical protein
MCAELRVDMLSVCVCGDTILAEVTVLCLLVVLYTSLKMFTVGGRNM